MSKKYYWLKLKEDFFRSKEIKELLLVVMQSAMDGKIVVSDAPEDFKFVEL